MCNQTETYREIADYDKRAARGEVPMRGVGHERELSAKTRKKIREAILRKTRRETAVFPLLEWLEKRFRPEVSDGDARRCMWELLNQNKIKLTPNQCLQRVVSRQSGKLRRRKVI